MMKKSVMPLLLASWIALPVHAQENASGEPKILVYGNYCGPGNNAPLPPIDALDAACARHDACTPIGAIPSRACNARLKRDADAVSKDPRQPANLRMMAGFVAAAAALFEITN